MGPKFNLRVVPWWTDGCSTFLNNLFKWLPGTLGRRLTALEFGGGNSTFYLLAKGLKVVCVESDDGYIQFLRSVAESVGHSVSLDLSADVDLVLTKAGNLSETGGLIDQPWDIVIDDGISRREVLEHIHQTGIDTIVILDNVEYAANWGRLDRGSAKPDLIKAYRAFLRDPNWRSYIFEQPEGRDGRGSADKCGWESPHRWASTVAWQKDHILARLMVSNIGLPLVNELGADDKDTESLSERCPFDWETMQWLKPHFPDELDLKLTRSYD